MFFGEGVFAMIICPPLTALSHKRLHRASIVWTVHFIQLPTLNPTKKNTRRFDGARQAEKNVSIYKVCKLSRNFILNKK
jgi:hypothetical protein